MDPRSRIYNTPISRDELLDIADQSFKWGYGGTTEKMYEWRHEVIEEFSKDKFMLIGVAILIMQSHTSSNAIHPLLCSKIG